MVNVAAVQPSSYACTLHALKKLKLLLRSYASFVFSNLLSASITRPLTISFNRQHKGNPYYQLPTSFKISASLILVFSLSDVLFQDI